MFELSRCWIRLCLISLVFSASADCGFAQDGGAASHPLDPLTASELVTVRHVLANSGRFSPDTNYVWIALEEPPKDLVKNFRPGSEFPRRASVTAVDYAKRKTFAVTVDVKAARIAAIKDLGGLQPGITDRDIAIARSVVNSDARIRAALLKRGLKISGNVTDAVQTIYYSPGHDETLDANRDRLLRVVFASDQTAVNAGSPLLDGVMAIIDLYSKKVVELDDRVGVPSVPVPHDIFNPKLGAALDRRGPTPVRQRPNDLAITGNVVVWQNWRFRYGFNLREGLVLYQIDVKDGAKWRPVLYRASVSEVVTAYMDPDRFWSWLEVIDEGGGGLGDNSLAVQPGREVPAGATTLDVLLPDAAPPNYARLFDNRIYIYERDGGNLMYYRQGDRIAYRKSTELVVGFYSTLGNYDYGFNWIFKQDGSFAFEVELAGEVLTRFVPATTCQVCAEIARGPGAETRTIQPSGDDRYGTLVYRNVVAGNHQHWFNLRLDFDIDGANNAVMENNVQRISHNARPGGGQNAGDRVAVQTHTIFARAVDAKRDANHDSSRSWTIYNPSSVGRLGRAAGYTIMPGENAMPVFPARRVAGPVGFTLHHFWVTPLRSRELFAAGAYPDQAKPDYIDTLYHYANGDLIYDRDIVIWYSLGMIYIPRVEDFPLMPVEKLGVSFVPDGFFTRNPALGPPPDK